MEDDLNFQQNGRRHQLFKKMEDDLIFFYKIEDDLNCFLSKRKTTSIFNKMEDDLNILQNGRRPQCSIKWKTSPIFYKLEVDLIYFEI